MSQPKPSSIEAFNREDLATALWDRCNRSDGPEACWEWEGPTDWAGYGRLTLTGSDGKAVSFKTHRVAYYLAHPDQMIEGVRVRQRCKNRKCVNPNHLVTAGKAAAWSPEHRKHLKERASRGEKHGRSKLTLTQVRRIREEFSYTGSTALARKYKVSLSLIYRIINREIWKED